MRLQTAASLITVALAAYFRLSRTEWAMLVLAICLVLIAEIINSAVERVTDVLKPRINSYVKEIKDIMAAAVLLASLTAIIVGIIIFWPHAFTLLNNFKF